MNQEKNNEIDLMLRKLGRQSDGLAKGNSSDSADDEHLDADELNMYAENVLVPATRARYTEHLADCTQCRQIVSKLTLAAGGVLHEKKAIVPASSGLKDLLSRLFSPMVLRYAAPALVLMIITSIGFWVFTDSWSRRSATQNDSVQSVAKNEPAAQATTITNAVQDNAREANTSTQPAKQIADTRQRTEEQQQPAATPSEVAKETEERKRDEATKVTDQIAAVPANVSGASAPAAPRPVTEKAGEDVVAKKNKAAEPPPAPRDADAEKKSESKAEYQPKLGIANVARSKAAKQNEAEEGRGQRQRESDEPARRADKDDDAETKSVAGRQFRKEGSKWIDTAYRSQDTTNISRGSEQYRALIADEPPIRTIADQLGGEVIVVWKGRAYRIR